MTGQMDKPCSVCGRGQRWCVCPVELTGEAADKVVRMLAKRNPAHYCVMCAGLGTTPYCGKHDHNALDDGLVLRPWND